MSLPLLLLLRLLMMLISDQTTTNFLLFFPPVSFCSHSILISYSSWNYNNLPNSNFAHPINKVASNGWKITCIDNVGRHQPVAKNFRCPLLTNSTVTSANDISSYSWQIFIISVTTSRCTIYEIMIMPIKLYNSNSAGNLFNHYS